MVSTLSTWDPNTTFDSRDVKLRPCTQTLRGDDGLSSSRQAETFSFDNIWEANESKEQTSAQEVRQRELSTGDLSGWIGVGTPGEDSFEPPPDECLQLSEESCVLDSKTDEIGGSDWLDVGENADHMAEPVKPVEDGLRFRGCSVFEEDIPETVTSTAGDEKLGAFDTGATTDGAPDTVEFDGFGDFGDEAGAAEGDRSSAGDEEFGAFDTGATREGAGAPDTVDFDGFGDFGDEAGAAEGDRSSAGDEEFGAFDTGATREGTVDFDDFGDFGDAAQFGDDAVDCGFSSFAIGSPPIASPADRRKVCAKLQLAVLELPSAR